MAVDTRDKRDSAVGLSLPWRCRLPLPDGSLAATGDRLHLAYLYSGLGAAAATTPPITDFTLDFDYVRAFTVDCDFARGFVLDFDYRRDFTLEL